MRKIVIYILFVVFFTSAYSQTVINSFNLYDFIEMDDGSFIAAGSADFDLNQNFDFYYVKIDQFGETIWDKTIDFDNNDACKFLVNCGDHVLLIGETGYNSCVTFLIDDIGYVFKNNTINIPGSIVSYDQYTDTSLLIMNTENDFFEVSHNGDSISSFQSNAIFNYENANSFTISHDDNSLFLLGTSRNSAVIDMHLIQVGFNGDVIANNIYDFEARIDIGQYIIKHSGDNYLLGGGLDFFNMIMVDELGNEIWKSVYSPEGYVNYSMNIHMVETHDNGIFMIGGYIEGDAENLYHVYIVKTDTNGEIIWDYNLDHDYIKPIKVIQRTDSSYVVLTTDPFYFKYTVFIFEENGNMISSANNSVSNDDIDKVNRISIYPVPAKSSIQVHLDNLKPEVLVDILDVNGRILLQDCQINKSKFSVNMSNFINGIYFIKLTIGDEIIIKKIIKE